MQLTTRHCEHCGGLLVVTHTVRAQQYKIQYFRCRSCKRRPPKGTKRILFAADPIKRCRPSKRKSSKAQSATAAIQR